MTTAARPRRAEHGGVDPPAHQPRRTDLSHRRGRQYTSIAYTERLADIGAAPSIGTVGDPLRQRPRRIGHGHLQDRAASQPRRARDNGGPWRGLDDLEIATCAWVSWFNGPW